MSYSFTQFSTIAKIHTITAREPSIYIYIFLLFAIFHFNWLVPKNDIKAFLLTTQHPYSPSLFESVSFFSFLVFLFLQEAPKELPVKKWPFNPPSHPHPWRVFGRLIFAAHFSKTCFKPLKICRYNLAYKKFDNKIFPLRLYN